MLSKIERFIEAGSDWASTSTRAENILSQIEELGMLPPAVRLKKTGKGCLCTMHEGCEECDHSGLYHKNVWEPEIDTLMNEIEKEFHYLPIEARAAIYKSRKGILENKKTELVKFDMGPNASKNAKKDLFKEYGVTSVKEAVEELVVALMNEHITIKSIILEKGSFMPFLAQYEIATKANGSVDIATANGIIKFLEET